MLILIVMMIMIYKYNDNNIIHKQADNNRRNVFIPTPKSTSACLLLEIIAGMEFAELYLAHRMAVSARASYWLWPFPIKRDPCQS